MRCLTCQSLSIKAICKSCQEKLLIPTIKKRELARDFIVYSFFEYKDIKELLNTKYEFYGDRVFNILANISFSKFAKEFSYTSVVFAISVDDVRSHQFSQASILAKSLNSLHIKPLYNKLLTKNKIKYAGKSLEYRNKNKRDFKYKGKENIQVILVDDIVTSGNTLQEAKKVLENNNCEVLFALTLSDAKI